MAEPTVDVDRGGLTVGPWKIEKQSADAFDAAIGDKLWRVYREVRGVLLQPRPSQVDKTVRIDRVLVPGKPLLDAGWAYGVIGIELKRSGEKIGPALAQATDYTRCAFSLPGGVRVLLDWVFVWPMSAQSGTVASICEQNRVGSAWPGGPVYGPAVRMKAGSVPIVDVHLDGRAEIRIDLNRGTKVGRR